MLIEGDFLDRAENILAFGNPGGDFLATQGETDLVALLRDATGTTALVQKALQTGRPVLGMGPGNVPAYIGASAVPIPEVANAPALQWVRTAPPSGIKGWP